MAYTTTTTASRGRNLGRRAGFTLVEVMISAALGSFLVMGVLSTFLFIGRTQANLVNYGDMEGQSRRSLETFAQDVRQANDIAWASSTDFTITVNLVAIRYHFDSDTDSFIRTSGGSSRTLITGITPSTFVFRAYDVAGNELPLATAANRTLASINTKQLQLSLEASRSTKTVATATNLVLSARYILRNKIVTV